MTLCCASSVLCTGVVLVVVVCSCYSRVALVLTLVHLVISAISVLVSLTDTDFSVSSSFTALSISFWLQTCWVRVFRDYCLSGEHCWCQYNHWHL